MLACLRDQPLDVTLLQPSSVSNTIENPLVLTAYNATRPVTARQRVLASSMAATYSIWVEPKGVVCNFQTIKHTRKLRPVRAHAFK